MNTTDANAFVMACRTQATNLITTLNKLRALRNKYDALGLDEHLAQASIGGDNDGMLVADIAAVLGGTLEAFEGLLPSGHATNLHKIALV